MADSSFDPTFLNIPIRALTINGSTFPIVTREATIIRGVNKHDTMELSCLLPGQITFDGKVRIPLDEAQPASGTRDVDVQTLVRQPVSFVYGVSPQTEQFVGYITQVQQEEKFKEGLNLKLTLTGASLVLQKVIRRFDTLVTVPNAVSNRVNAQWLGFYGDPHTFVWPTLAQTIETDWEMCVKLADSIGYLIFPWGAVVRAQDPRLLFKQFPYTLLTTSDDLLESDRKLMDFNPMEQSSDLLDKQGLEVFFFDPNGKVVSLRQNLTGNSPLWTPFTERAVESREEAQVILNAAESSVLRWQQQASARIRGDAAIYPGLIVDVAAGGTNFNFNGRWLVVQVSHSMNRQAFQTELRLTRPLHIPSSAGSIFQHWWTTAGMAKPTAWLREGQWFSSLSNPAVRAVA